MRFDRLVSPAVAVLVIAAAPLIGGCVNHSKPAPQDDRIQTSPAATIAYERDSVLDLLDYARQLREASPEARAEAVANARTRVDDTPGASSYAYLALAYGTPGQRRYTPDEAERYVQRALGAGDSSWSPAAKQYLGDLARLYSKAARPPDTSTKSSAPTTPGKAQPAQSAATIPTDTPRVRALEQALDDARRKLRELADIEDRLSESGS